METRQRMQQLRTPMDPLAYLAVVVVVAAAGLQVPAPAAPGRGGARAHRAPPPPPSRHAGLHLPLLHAPLRARACAAASGRAHAAAHGAGVLCGRHLRGARARARAVRGVQAPRGLPQVRATAGPRGAAAGRHALAGAFARTLRQLESAAGGEWPGMELAVRAVRTGMRWWRPTAASSLDDEGFGGPAAEKLAAELLWLGQKMAECGALREAVVQFGAAERLGSRALFAEPALQVSLLRVAVFLFKHANSREFEQSAGGKGDKAAVAEQRMAMLRSWPPLLCRGSNGTDAPVLTCRERPEMVAVLEDLIDKLSWEQREEVLSLWLHHFAACPDTDWPNLESCYTRWYAESRRLLA